MNLSAFNVDVIILTGPTASGKTNLALELAQRWGGIIINGDSQQLYQGLPILTACPTEQEKKLVPHFLYEVAHPEQDAFSCGIWKQQVEAILEKYRPARAWIVGGSGLYLQTLTHGLSPIPSVPPQVLDDLRSQAKNHEGLTKLYETLKEVDTVLALKLHPHDTQRIIRALGVFYSTGKPLSLWQQHPPVPSQFAPYTHVIKLMPSLNLLQEAVQKRTQAMLAQGVITEVQLFLQQFPQAAHRAPYHALGVIDIKNYLEGKLTLKEVEHQLVLKTRQYAKRQLTWLRHHWPDALSYTSAQECAQCPGLAQKITDLT